MDAGNRYQTGAAAIVKFIEIGLMLEKIGVHPLLVHLNIGLDVIREYFHIQFHTLFCQLGFQEFQNFRMGHGRRSHGELLRCNRARESGRCNQRYERFLQIHKRFSCFTSD
jgi:hypothetical protein